MKKSVCVVGERCNGRRRSHWDTASIETWAKFTWSVAAFFDGPSRSKLLSIGLDWHSVKCVNLMPPSPVIREWNARRASETVNLMGFSEFALVFACGVKVCSAMGFIGKLTDSVGEIVPARSREIVPLPHPSGLNRFWNNQGAVSRLKNKITELLKE